ncbi:MAG: hypothetical protein ACK5MA_06610 [Parachlamydiaceae bacterium]
MGRYFILFFLLLASCREDSSHALREAGRAKTRSLIAELKKIRSKDQLVAEEAKMKECFSEFLLLVEEADALEQVPLPLDPVDHELSDALRVEMLRIARIDGGKDVLLQVLISR